MLSERSITRYRNREQDSFSADTVMDLINNERGRTVGQSVPFYYSNDHVAQAVIADMLANPEAYCVLVDNYCMTPIQ